MTNPPVVPKALIAGQKRTHPSHIPSHFPEFPDPHTYIKTPVRQPLFQTEEMSLYYHNFITNTDLIINTFKCSTKTTWVKELTPVLSPPDVSGACVRLPGGEREGGVPAEGCGAGADTLHGQDGRNAEPL